MGPTMKDLGIDKLHPEQRLALAQEIWDSLPDARPGSLITDEQWAEIHRRDAEMDATPGIVLTWEELQDRLGWPR